MCQAGLGPILLAATWPSCWEGDVDPSSRHKTEQGAPILTLAPPDRRPEQLPAPVQPGLGQNTVPGTSGTQVVPG